MKQKRASEPRPRAKPPRARAARTPAIPIEGPRLSIRMVEAPVPYAEVSIHEPVTEDSIEKLFEQARAGLMLSPPRRVLVDLTDAKLRLSISDLNGLAKLVAGSFAGVVERLAIVLQPVDVPAEKFFEPAMSNRGVPTFVSLERNEAIDWLTAQLHRPR